MRFSVDKRIYFVMLPDKHSKFTRYRKQRMIVSPLLRIIVLQPHPTRLWPRQLYGVILRKMYEHSLDA